MDFLKKVYHWSSSWTGTFVIVFGIIFFIAQAFVIPSGSMKKTLLVGDMLFVKKFSYGIPEPRIPWVEWSVLPDFMIDDGHLIKGEKPQRGDIVVFYAPHERARGNRVHYVKRCVATGGDILFVKDKDLYIHYKEGNDYITKNFSKEKIENINNYLFVKNPYIEKFPGIHNDPSVTKSARVYPQPIFDTPLIQVPDGEFFMMGDNRDHSNDSRYWGSVPYKDIVGTPWFVYFSWDENKTIRWERVFQGIDSLNDLTDKYETKHQEGIY
jgi:signal peptidase I